MATTNKGLEQPTLNSTNWNTPLNANFGSVDAALGGTVTKSVTGVGTTPVVLTLSEYQNLILNFTGTLTSNVTYHIPSGIGGQWTIRNATTGSFTLTIGSAGGGSSVSVSSGSRRIVYSDGTNIRFSNDESSASIPSGSVAYSSGSGLVGTSGLTYNGTVLDIQATTAATDTATEVLFLDSQSTGTPAVGVGTTVSFATETAAGNTETGMQISAVTTSVTPGLESFDFVLRLMSAGAAASTALKVSATGTAFLNAILDPAGGNTASINGIVPAIASQAQAQAGTDNTALMTPLRTAEAIAALAAGQSLQVFTATGTYTPTAGYSKALVIATGGGQRGGSVTGGGVGDGGDAGTTVISLLDISSGASIAIAVGAAGGTTGGNTTVGTTTMVAPGGGQVTSPVGQMIISGGDGGGGTSGSGDGGDSFWGGGGVRDSGNGSSGQAYGSGGGGGQSSSGSASGGSGRAGVVFILEFK